MPQYLKYLLLCLAVRVHNCYECDKDAVVCETSLVIEQMLTMTHPVHRAVWANNGHIYKVSDVNSTAPIDYSDVITADGSDEYRTVVVANGSLPGPELILYEGQKLRINVINHLKSETTTIHWHGLPQHDTPWMDGVGYVTQCPIQPGSEFMYQFYARPKGTYWYHAHVGSQRTKGLFGALVIREKSQSSSNEHIMTINGWNHLWDADMDHLKMVYGIFMNRTEQEPSVSVDGGRFSRFRLTSALINGKGRYYEYGIHNGAPLSVFNVEPNQQYRLRIIATGALYPFQVSVDEHVLSVISSDGYDLEQENADSIIINPGERYDVLIATNATLQKNYWIRAKTLESNVDHIAEAILRYTGAPDEDPTSQKRACTANDRCLVVNCPFTYFPKEYYTDCKRFDQLRSVTNDDPAPNGKGDDFEEYFLNFAFPGTTRYPGSVNGIEFKVPTVSALTQPLEIDSSCDNAGCGEEKQCHCTHSLTLRHNKTIQMVMLNMGNGRGWAHPIHMHGYSFYVVKMGYADHDNETGAYIRQNQDVDCRGDFDMDKSFCNNATWRNSSWLHGNVPDIELANAPRKDTIIIPSGGYAVVRILSNNPGVWIMHCHIELHSTDGMSMVLNNSYGHGQSPPSGFPKCGNFKYPQYTVPRPRPMPNPSDPNDRQKKKMSDEDEAYTAKMFWIVVAVLGLIMLLLIGIIAAMRGKIRDLKQKQYKPSVSQSEASGKENPVFTVT